jgi:hypothetical protein
MIIIDAYWEKRNLGVDCNEITIDKGDCEDIDLLKLHITQNTVEYTVVKVPTGMIPVMFMLEDMGFHFIEGMVRFSHDLISHEKHFSENLKKMAAFCTLKKLDEMNFEDLFAEIRKGIFNTDRVYNDPYFEKGMSAERYIGWIKDAYRNGMDIYEFMFKGKASGFKQFKIDKNFEVKGTLGGLYTGSHFPGLAGLHRYSFLCNVLSRGAKKIPNSYVSVNNPKAIRLNLALGYQYEETQYVYVKHLT